jgi:hypothetical protein
MCKLPGEGRLGLMFRGLPTLEFTANKGLDSMSSEKIEKNAFRKIFPASDEATLDIMVDEQFCSYKCTIPQDERPEVTDDLCNFDSRRSTSMTLSERWALINWYIWKWRVFDIVLILALIGSIALFIALLFRHQWKHRAAAEHHQWRACFAAARRLAQR